MTASLLALLLAMSGFQSTGVETIAKDRMSAVDEARTAVAKTAAEWSTLWQAHNGATPPPKVDFSKRMAAAVFLGSRPSAGYAVEITGTRQDGKVLVIEWRETRPAPGMLTAQVLTSPAHLVSLPKFDGEVRFEKAGK